jgi:hypothetical protein
MSFFSANVAITESERGVGDETELGTLGPCLKVVDSHEEQVLEGKGREETTPDIHGN